MKTQIALISLFAIPAMAIAQKPAGVLGVDNVYFYGTYESAKAPDGEKSEFANAGIGVSQNMFEGEKFGMDAGLNFEYWENLSDGIGDDYSACNYTGSITGYMKGAVAAPFASAMIWYSDSESGSYSDTSTWGALKLGIEFHVADGWYLAPSATAWTDLDSDKSSSTEWVYTLETGYWFTERVMGFVNVNYEEEDDYSQTWYSLGAALRY